MCEGDTHMPRNRSAWYCLCALSLWTLHMALPASGASAGPQPGSAVPQSQLALDSSIGLQVETHVEAARKTLTQIIDLLDRIQDRQQYRDTLQRQLITALMTNDTKQASRLV